MAGWRQKSKADRERGRETDGDRQKEREKTIKNEMWEKRQHLKRKHWYKREHFEIEKGNYALKVYIFYFSFSFF